MTMPVSGRDGSLPPELRRIAEEELGETDERRREALKKLSCMLQEDPQLYPRLDADFLLRFIRVRKYNLDASLKTVKKYYRNRATAASIYAGVVPSSVKAPAKDLYMILPERDAHGRLVLVCKMGEWDPSKLSYSEFQHAGFLCLDSMAQDPSSQTAGISLLVDYANFTMSNVFSFKLSTVKTGVEYMQDCLPVRVKALHIVRQSYAFNLFYMIVRPFLKQKIVERIHFHGLDFEGLHRDIPPSKLPEEYGGQAPPLNFNAFWRRMDADENLFKENGRYGYRDAFVT